MDYEKDNNNDDLSRSMSLLEIKRKFFNTNYEYTPFKPEEINYEIYPNENFMKYNSSTNNIYKILNNKSDISVCSTEVSFSIQSKYENIDSNY